MRVKIEYVVDVSDEFRRAINAYYGDPGLASREKVKQWFWRYGESMNDELALAESTRDIDALG